MIRTAALVLATMLLPACQSAAPSPGAAAAGHPLIGTSWLAQDIDERGVLDGLQSTLAVESAERVSGQAGCNRYFGRVGLEESNIAISRVGSTKMVCPPAVMDQERRFLDALQAAASWERGGDILLIFDGERRQRLRLSALPPSPRAGDGTVAGARARAAVLRQVLRQWLR
jgi:heat shock protein HslJ